MQARDELAGYRVFAERQMRRYAAMQRAGLGQWVWPGRPKSPAVRCWRPPAACSAIQPAADGLGRFQYVSTHPAWRRRGLCTALVHAACRHGFEAMDLRTLAMVADPADVAIDVYESLGFRRGVSAWQLQRAPR